MSSPPAGRNTDEQSTSKESISSRFGAIRFKTPEFGGVGLGAPDYADTAFKTPGPVALGQALRCKGTPNTIAPKIARVQRERERARLAKKSRVLRSGDSRTTAGDSTVGDIIMHLDSNAEDMNSSMLRKNSRGLILKPTIVDDVFTAIPAQGRALDWMHRRAKKGLSEITSSEIEHDTPTKNPRKKEDPPKKDPLKKYHLKKLGIPFPNFGRFWCAKYNWHKVQGASVVKMFEECDPEDKGRVKELYELAWVIKLSTAMVQCDMRDQTRIQQLVQWAQNFRNDNDWQRPTPLGWNLKQQQYVGPRPSDEERQRFVDYAWQMDQNQVTQTSDDGGKRKYYEAALEVFAFREKYPDFPHDYPPGYPGEHPDYKSEPLYRRLSHYNKFPEKEEKVEVIKKPKGMKRKASAVEDDVIQNPLNKKTKAPARTAARRKSPTADVDGEDPRRSGRCQGKSTVGYRV